jgi:hypothetical protein
MEYRGKQYIVVQGIDPRVWKWTVHSDEKIIRSGTAPSRETARGMAIWVIDEALENKARCA